jgi:hypothetical protein
VLSTYSLMERGSITFHHFTVSCFAVSVIIVKTSVKLCVGSGLYMILNQRLALKGVPINEFLSKINCICSLF